MSKIIIVYIFFYYWLYRDINPIEGVFSKTIIIKLFSLLNFKSLILSPITTLSIDNVEADDIMAYIANELYTEDENRATIVSTDRDFLQLVNNRISVWSPIKKKLYTPELMREEFGISSNNNLL